MAGPLEGIRILDLSWVLSAPFATMVLSDLGAEVIKIERLEVGDIARGNGPFVKGLSSYFVSLNRGKKSVTLNLASEQGKDIFLNYPSLRARAGNKAYIQVLFLCQSFCKGRGLNSFPGRTNWCGRSSSSRWSSSW